MVQTVVVKVRLVFLILRTVIVEVDVIEARD